MHISHPLHPLFTWRAPTHHQRGISLVVVLLILVIVSLLGVASIQITRLATQSARNERDTQIAWQAAEAALLDAELDIQGQPRSHSGRRGHNANNPDDPSNYAYIFSPQNTDTTQFLPGCGTSSTNKGLCNTSPSQAPSWLSVEFLKDAIQTRAQSTPDGTPSPVFASNIHSVQFGDFTGRSFQAGVAGIQPAHPPRYIIELLDDPNLDSTTNSTARKYIYRITAIGFGPSEKTQVVLQTIYRN